MCHRLADLLAGLAGWLGLGRELPLAPGERRLAVSAEARARQGSLAEQAAERHLRARGYRILCRRRANDRGELDLVALQGQTVVFIEVRSRAQGSPVLARDSLTAAKRRHLVSCAELFVKQHGLGRRPRRFDLIAATLPAGGGEPALEHLVGALGAQAPRKRP